MRRLKAPADHPSGFYHCISRVVDRRHIFQTVEKEHFVRLLREYQTFCRVRILTYCVMSNHFHILLEVPRRPDPANLPTPEQIVADLRQLTGHQTSDAVRQRFEALHRANDSAGLAAYLGAFHARMYDVSAFMKMVKQRFTQWFNVRTGRKGTLWEERFRSVLVDSAGRALTTMAAYIDLNPVRAGLVKDPKNYRWCGYAEAVGGRSSAQSGIQAIATTLHRGVELSPSEAMAAYRMHLFVEGTEEREAIGDDGTSVRGALPREAALEVLAAGGHLSQSEYLRCRVRYFCDGAVFGGREFVEGVLRAYRDRFSPRRPAGAHPLKGITEDGLFVLLDLRRSVFG